MDVNDKIEFVRSTLTPMAWHTHLYTCSVMGFETDDSGRHVGSAVRMTLGGKRGVVTAAHVVEQARTEYQRFGVTALRGGEPHELQGAPEHADPVSDLAIFYLSEDYPASEIKFWPEERMDTDEEMLSTDLLFVHGFPAVRSEFSALAGGLVNRSFPYGVMRREDALPADIQNFQFAMDFDPENMLAPDGRRADWLDPHGLAGSPVWRIGASGRRADTWSPELSLLVGIVTQWRPVERILVATKCSALIELLRT